MDKSTPNGGFPPIFLCKKKLKKTQEQNKRERSYTPEDVKNININQIINNNFKKPIIKTDSNNKLEEINEF